MTKVPFLFELAFFLSQVFCPAASQDTKDFQVLFAGKSIENWTVLGHQRTWDLKGGSLTASGPQSVLCYGVKDLLKGLETFELRLQLKTEGSARAFLLLRKFGRVLKFLINNSSYPFAPPCERLRTGSVLGLRSVWTKAASDGEWFELKIQISGKRIKVFVKGFLVADFEVPEKLPYKESGIIPTESPICLEWEGGEGSLSLRRLSLRRNLPAFERGPYPGKIYGLKKEAILNLSRRCFPFVDFHVHLRGGMTVEKAISRQAETGVGIGVLRNIGKGWPIETDKQLREFLKGVKGKPLFVGLQVNDRDWFKKHDRSLLRQLDYVLADTMIMPMPTDKDKPVKLWLSHKYRIKDPERWMERYMRHNLRVLSEPISILANPTYLPPQVSHLYDRLWTEERMEKVIKAAVENNVALEINARSGLPHERFIRLAKKHGARFSFGTNNFDLKPISLERCLRAVEKYDLRPEDMFLPWKSRFR